MEEKAAIPAKFQSLVDSVEKMSVIELHELVKVLENRFGVSAAAVAAAPAAGAAPAAAAAPAKTAAPAKGAAPAKAPADAKAKK